MPVPKTLDSESTKANATRRRLLTGAAAGLATLAGGSAAGLWPASPAEAATTGTDWTVLTASGVTDGTQDTPNINNALQAAYNSVATSPPTTGPVVYLSAGIYYTNAPIVVPSGVSLRGPSGATQSGDTASSLWGAVIVPTSSTATPWTAKNTVKAGQPDFPVAGIITMIDFVTSGGGANNKSSRMDIRDLWINGNGLYVNGTGAPIDGIASWGPMNAVTVARVGIDKVTGNGIGFYLNTNCNSGPHNSCPTANFADGWLLDTVLAQSAGGNGIYGNIVDGTLINCHAQSCGSTASPPGSGIVILGANNRLIGCRADLCAGYGFVLDSFTGGSGYYDANTLIGCGTQRNQKSALFVTNSSGTGQDPRSPVFANGCSFDGDGTLGGGAGMEVSGETRLIAVNCNVLAGTKDVATGCPDYAILTDQAGSAPGVPDLVQVSGSFLNAASAIIKQNAAPISLRVDPSNSSYAGGPFTGITASPPARAVPVQLPDYLGGGQDLFLHQTGTLAATMPRAMATTAVPQPTSGTLTSGTLYVTAIALPAGLTISNCTMFVNSTPANGVKFGGYVLLDQDLTVQAVTASQPSAWAQPSTGYPAAFAKPYSTTQAGVYYVGVVISVGSGGQMPTFTGAPTLAKGIAGLTGLSPQTPSYCGFSSTNLTALPAVGATMASITTNGEYLVYATLS